MASGHTDGKARIWNGTGKLIRTLEMFPGQVEAVTWSPDGKTLAGSCLNGWLINQIRLWDVASGEARGILQPMASPHGLAVSSAGHYRGTPNIEAELVYVIQTDRGQDTITPAEFAQR